MATPSPRPKPMPHYERIVRPPTGNSMRRLRAYLRLSLPEVEDHVRASLRRPPRPRTTTDED